MSTRANYIFKSGRKTLATFYIHHDGYPEGAAGYFQNALLLGDGMIDSPDVFLRANDRCESTTCIHGDIDYLYEFNIKDQTIKVFSIGYTEDGTKERHPQEILGIHYFVNKYFTVFSDNEDYIRYQNLLRWKTEKERETRIIKENQWFKLEVKDRYGISIKTKYRCLKRVYQDLKEAAQELVDVSINYGPKNPNFIQLEVYQYGLMKQLESLLTLLEDSNNG
jgi:hypothetical protein